MISRAPLPPILSLYKPSRDWRTVLRNLAELFADPRRHLKGSARNATWSEATKCCAVGGIELLSHGLDAEIMATRQLDKALTRAGPIQTNDSRDGRRKIIAGCKRALEKGAKR